MSDNKMEKGGDDTQWEGACVAFVRPWLQPGSPSFKDAVLHNELADVVCH